MSEYEWWYLVDYVSYVPADLTWVRLMIQAYLIFLKDPRSGGYVWIEARLELSIDWRLLVIRCFLSKLNVCDTSITPECLRNACCWAHVQPQVNATYWCCVDKIHNLRAGSVLILNVCSLSFPIETSTSPICLCHAIKDWHHTSPWIRHE